MKFEDIANNYYQKIFNYCYGKLNDKQLAEDCTQDVFLILYKKMNSLKISTNIEAWLYKTALLQLKNYYKKIKNEISLEEIENITVSDTYSHDNSLTDLLSDEDFNFLNDYYTNGIDSILKHNKISKMAIYQRISRIKHKLSKVRHFKQ